MKSEELIKRIEGKFSSSIVECKTDIKQPYVEIDPSKSHSILGSLKDDDDFAFNYLRCLSGVDDGDKFMVVYHLYSYKNNHELVVKVRADRSNPVLDSVSDLWAVADWHEREAYDLLGIKFKNHPDLRRILLPDDWIGHPLRKDYIEPESYRGIPTTRKKEN